MVRLLVLYFIFPNGFEALSYVKLYEWCLLSLCFFVPSLVKVDNFDWFRHFVL